MANEAAAFVKGLRDYRHILTRQQVKSMKGMALSGHLEQARKSLKTALKNKNTMTLAHQGARKMKTMHPGIDYKTQVGINLSHVSRLKREQL